MIIRLKPHTLLFPGGGNVLSWYAQLIFEIDNRYLLDECPPNKE